MKVLVPIVIGFLVAGCGESTLKKVVKDFDGAKVTEAKVLTEANVTDTLVANFAALSPRD